MWGVCFVRSSYDRKLRGAFSFESKMVVENQGSTKFPEGWLLLREG